MDTFASMSCVVLDILTNCYLVLYAMNIGNMLNKDFT